MLLKGKLDHVGLLFVKTPHTLTSTCTASHRRVKRAQRSRVLLETWVPRPQRRSCDEKIALKYNSESARWRLVLRPWKMEPYVWRRGRGHLLRRRGVGWTNSRAPGRKCSHQIPPQKMQKQPSVHVA